MNQFQDALEDDLEMDEESDDLELQPPTSDLPDLDTYSDRLSPDQISFLAAPKKPVNKPDISHLPNGIGKDGYPVFVAGDKIVIERYTSFLHGNPYLDTRTYKVQKVDHVTGKIDLWDESLDQQAVDNWKYGVKIGQQYRLSLGRLVSSKKKRGRPRKETPHTEITPPSDTPKRGRGRPKGAKNKPKDSQA